MKKRRLWTIIQFAWKEVNYTKFLIIASIVVVVFYIYKSLSKIEWEPFNFFDPVLSFITAILAVAIWYNEMIERWERSLEKKLNAHFIYNNEYVCSCFEAYLTDPADIRAWGQQLGGQMCKGPTHDKAPFLNFEPYIHLVPRELREEDGGKKYWQYIVYFILDSDPIPNKYEVWRDIPEMFGKYEKQCLSTRTPFDLNTIDEINRRKQ